MHSPDTNAHPRYQFADLTLDVGQQRAWRGQDPVALSNLSFELLRVLVESSPNVVAHDELARRAWGPRRIVTPENLAKRVMLLRQALGDQADHSRYIEGVRGRGYRLLPEVRSVSGEAPTGKDDAGSGPVASSPAAPRETSRRGVYWAAIGLLGLTASVLFLDDVRLRRAARSDAATTAEPTAAPPFSFTLSAPAGSTFGAAPAQPTPALSPDGQRLAFIAPLDSHTMLWIQALGALDAKVVAGTEGAQQPFWSPDGQFIAFAQHGKLKRIATEGRGAPQDLVLLDNARAFAGGAWAADGTIVFAGTEGLYRWTDGVAAALTAIDASRGELAHRYPRFLPDSKRFVYLVLSTEAEHQGVFLGSLDEPGLKTRLVPSAANAEVGTGPNRGAFLVFLDDGRRLVAQAFDAGLDRLTGDPVVVASQPIEPGPSVRFAAFTAGGRVLAYRPRFAPASRLVWFDRKGLRRESVGLANQSYRFPALSDNETKLAAMRDDVLDASGLWWFDLQRRTAPERLTRGVELMSAWSPDGERIIYSAPRPEGWSLLEQRIGTPGDARTLLAGATPVAKWIRDVTRELLLFQGPEGDLWVLPLGGEREAYRLIQTPGVETHARLSPDGRWLAFSSTDANETRVYVTTFPEPTERWLVSPAGGSDPQWRRDGRELYYIAPDDTLMAVEVGTEPTFVVGAATELFDARFDQRSRAFGSAYAPAANGERFLVAETSEPAEPYLVVTQNWAHAAAEPSSQ